MRLFVSYAHVNRALVEEWIVRVLRSGRHDIWFDVQIDGGDPWRQRLDQEIQRSEALVFAMTPASVRSETCLWEINRALELGKRIMPVLLEERTEIPEWLLSIQWVDFSKGPSPKVVASLMGGLEKLTQKQVPPALATGIPPQAIGQFKNYSDVVSAGQQIEEFLNAMHYRVTRSEDPGQQKISWTAQCLVHGTFLSRHLLCQWNILESDVSELQKKAHSSKNGEAWLFQICDISQQARQIIDADKSLKLFSDLESFYRSMLSYDSYLNDYLIDRTKNDIDPYWVELQCDDGTGNEYDVTGYVDRWLNVLGSNLLALVGDFGMGKTWFCRYFAAQIAQKHQSAPKHHRLPILISLRNATRHIDLPGLITATLANNYHIDMDFNVFDHLNRYGHLLLILDGFDEMEQRVDSYIVLQNLQEIVKLIGPKSKVILTSRPMFFPTSKQDLHAMLKHSTHERTQLLELRCFQEEQIKTLLQKYAKDWEYIWEKIKGEENLRMLVSRPVLSQIIAESMPEIIQSQKAISSVMLYEIQIKKWIRYATDNMQDFDPGALQDIQTLVYELMIEIAWEMFLQLESQTILDEQLHQILYRKFGIYPNELVIGIQGRVIRNFIRDSQTNNLVFPHISFMEYLVAVKIFQDLSDVQSESLFAKELTSGIRNFLNDMIRDNASVQVRLLGKLLTAETNKQITAIYNVLVLDASQGAVLPSIDQIIDILDRQSTGPSELPTGNLPQIVVDTLGTPNFASQISTLSPRTVATQYFVQELLRGRDIPAQMAADYLENQVCNRNLESKVREHAVEVLGRMKSPIAVDALGKLLNTQELEIEVRRFSAFMLTKYDSVKVGEILIDIIRPGKNNDLEQEILHPIWDNAVLALMRLSQEEIAYKIEHEIMPLYENYTDFRRADRLRTCISSIRENVNTTP